MLKKISYAIMLLVLSSDVAHAQYVWKRGQQVMVIPKVTTAAVVDSIEVFAVARTSAGTPVTTPAITWNVRDSAGIAVVKTGTSKMVLYPMKIAAARTTWLVGSWKTSSGTFRDSVTITVQPYVQQMRFTVGPLSTPQTWRSGQQLMVRPSQRFTLNPPTPLSGGSMTLRVSARTSSGVPVSGFRATWILRDTSAARLVILSDSSARVFNTATQTSYLTWVVASWATRSGIIRDSVRILVSTQKEKAFLAFLDTFPDTKRIVVFAEPYGYKLPNLDSYRIKDLSYATTRADSLFMNNEWAVITGSADSIGVDVVVDTLASALIPNHLLTVPVRFHKGFSYSLCYLGKNRFNGSVRILAPITPTGQAKCNSVYLAYVAKP